MNIWSFSFLQTATMLLLMRTFSHILQNFGIKSSLFPEGTDCFFDLLTFFILSFFSKQFKLNQNFDFGNTAQDGFFMKIKKF